MSSYELTVQNGGQTARLTLKDGTLFGFPSWRCPDGAEAWGTPSQGTCLSPNLTGGSIELSLGCNLYDWRAEVGASGSGHRLDDNGGSFPSGDFSWECTGKS